MMQRMRNRHHSIRGQKGNVFPFHTPISTNSERNSLFCQFFYKGNATKYALMFKFRSTRFLDYNKYPI